MATLPTRALRTLRLPALHGRWRLPGLLAGCAIAASGIALTLESRLGVGPFDVLNDGLSTQLSVSFGVASVLASTILTVLGWRLGARVGVGTLAAMLLIGPFVDLWLLAVPGPTALGARVSLLAAGTVLIALGLSLIIAAGLGAGPVEVLTLGLSGRGVPLRWVRTGLEVTLCMAGALLGGQLGVGTVVIALGIGHLMATFVPAERA